MSWDRVWMVWKLGRSEIADWRSCFMSWHSWSSGSSTTGGWFFSTFVLSMRYIGLSSFQKIHINKNINSYRSWYFLVIWNVSYLRDNSFYFYFNCSLLYFEWFTYTSETKSIELPLIVIEDFSTTDQQYLFGFLDLELVFYLIGERAYIFDAIISQVEYVPGARVHSANINHFFKEITPSSQSNRSSIYNFGGLGTPTVVLVDVFVWEKSTILRLNYNPSV